MNLKKWLLAAAISTFSATVMAQGWFNGNGRVYLSLTVANGQTYNLAPNQFNYNDSTGWYREDGLHIRNNSVYVVGEIPVETSTLGGYNFNSFYFFSAPNYGKIVAAVLRIPTYTVATNAELSLYDVGTAENIVQIGNAEGSSVGKSIFDDLGSGQLLGQAPTIGIMDYSPIQVVFNSVGLDYLNSFSPSSVIGIGASFTHFDITPVPEPSTYAMMLAGLGLLGLVRCRKQQQA